jgi:cysteine desulfurase / selenocysteine lyase
MSTSDSQKGSPVGSSVDLKSVEAIPALPSGLPDPETLARMANEFFTALPLTESSAGAMPTAADPVAFGDPSRFGSVSSSGAPSEAQLRTVTAALPASVQAQIPAIPGTLTALPSLPDAWDPSRFASSGAFSFLEEARPLFSFANKPVSPAEPLDTVRIPTETELHALAEELSKVPVPHIPETGLASTAPQIPGAAVSPNPSEFSVGYAFLKEIRQLVASPAIETSVVSPVSPGDISLLNLSSEPFDVAAIRRDFPILEERVNGKPLVWLDNAATTQKPKSVIDRLSHFYSHENSNIHRAAHELAARATDAYEAAREKVRRFLNAPSTKEIIFVRGATEGINLLAQSWGRQNIRKGDEIVITWLEHHANIVPWQMLCAETGARLRVAPVDDSGQILLDEYHKLLGPKTRLVSFAQVSNALGTVTPAREMIELAHRYGAKVLLDGAQAVSHMHVDVQAYDCDFYVFSGHKLFAPTGIGVVFGKYDILDNTQPWQGGGNMIQDVAFEKTTYQPPPGRFEAGTGNIADAVGLGAAIDYLSRVGMVNISRHEHDLLVYATEKLLRIPGLRLIGTAREKAGVLSFVLEGFRTEDVGAALNRQGIAVRAGHHCAQPILRRFGVESTVRPSLALYNTCEDIDALVAAVWNLKQGHTTL